LRITGISISYYLYKYIKWYFWSKFRTVIEKELETLYDAYYEELELYANQQQQFGSSTIEYHNDSVAEYDEEDDDDEYDDENDDENEDYEGNEHSSYTWKVLFNFGNSLTVKGAWWLPGRRQKVLEEISSRWSIFFY